MKWLRYGALGVFIIMMVAGLNSLAILLAPYSAYGRIASSLFAPVWQWGNNLLAYFAERMDSYAFYEVDVWIKSLSTMLIAIVTLVSSRNFPRFFEVPAAVPGILPGCCIRGRRFFHNIPPGGSQTPASGR